ncbi:CYFA0S01e06040g1_1 [Cyberlindnera fabianii]|uniref:CYFA0S01e06040g1_1 n=1 Tax=Cyberlindnera fabianii TaxID=36022 RepID=A0A061AHG8_CYBFA|nr:hypothetical protein BON22_0567 [Cyberlindnera fabianii]CDR36977.1 CYFA0S01e06040g1_1 [Cyberlindnera fabianii]
MTTIPLPDLRFDSSFRRSLHAKAQLSKPTTALKSKDDSESTTTPDEPLPITPLIVIQVVLKDVILMPLIQGIAWSSILLLAKPWLAAVARHGRQVGIQLYNSLGFNFNPRRLVA